MFHVKKTTILLYIAALMLVSLACGVSKQLPYSQNTPKVVTVMPTFESVRMVVSGLYPDEPLNIRSGAGGAKTGEYLHNGDVVFLYLSVNRGDTLWCAIEPDYTRWVACRYLKSE